MTETAALLLSSGNGPGECRLAVGHLLAHLKGVADTQGLALDTAPRSASHGPSSAVVQVSGAMAETFASHWTGVILWRATSPLRPRHKRRNWFVEVFRLPLSPQRPTLCAGDIRMETLRAGGPGGQHQNTTDSAVRATWQGYTVTVRSERSQHQNRRLALERLAALAALDAAEAEAAATASQRSLHHQLQRGAPRHTFVGPDFTPA